MHHDSMAQSPVPRPLPIPPPSPMLPPPEIKPPYELEMTSTGGGVKMVECTSVGPATNEARPAPEALPLPPVSGPSAIHYGRRRGSRPLCRCMKQRTDCGMRLSCARLGHRCLGVFPASLVRYRERQRRELGIERFRREGLCAEESDAATLPLGDVLPPTDADTASDEQSDAATLPLGDVLPPTDADTASDEQSDAATLPPVSGPSAIHYGRRRGSRPLCRCMKQRTDCGMRLSCARLGHRCLGVFPASLVRYRERQRRELGIERFRREGLCAEESDAATLPLGDVLPPTDADTASDEQSDAATLPLGDVLPPTDADTASDEQSDAATLPLGDVLPPTDADTALNEQSDAATLPPVSGPSAIHYGRRRGSRPLCCCMKQRTNGGTQNEHELARLWPTNEKVPLPPVDNLCMTYLRPSTSLTSAMGRAVPTSSAAYTTQRSHQLILPPVAPVVDRPPLPFVRAPTWWANMREHFHLLRVVLLFFSLFFEPFPC
ncbi:hypothetical protein LBRM_05_1230 [Leishmania braziliensis MHOM/BR/75/M2904]|uniref:Uncharacterized protein n=1 Tax=Leishmania braziliensis TaxID=5660 RepID=A4H4G7_LEIBR|nr:hypothetical protein LBRM_05_1230 [Leishmania braziliensis MHOM/BR/75/M2904]CAM36957.1 hypothetical protein LBRM_05_1230 [Leishmania braziliensis MHOM/BR/75/M2904]